MLCQVLLAYVFTLHFSLTARSVSAFLIPAFLQSALPMLATDKAAVSGFAQSVQDKSNRVT
jgi:hypothetical protein